MSLVSVITGIWNKAVQDWTAAETWIDDRVKAIEAALPGATTVINTVVADAKQAASDAIGLADTMVDQWAPTLTTTLEGGADLALTKYTGGLAVPLIPMTNDAIDRIVSLGKDTLDSWALKAKASLAENNDNAAATPTSGPGPVPTQAA